MKLKKTHTYIIWIHMNVIQDRLPQICQPDVPEHGLEVVGARAEGQVVQDVLLHLLDVRVQQANPFTLTSKHGKQKPHMADFGSELCFRSKVSL